MLIGLHLDRWGAWIYGRARRLYQAPGVDALGGHIYQYIIGVRQGILVMHMYLRVCHLRSESIRY